MSSAPSVRAKGVARGAHPIDASSYRPATNSHANPVAVHTTTKATVSELNRAADSRAWCARSCRESDVRPCW